MTTSKYILSFTACGALLHESIKLTRLYLDLRDWDAVRQETVSQNLLQSRTIGSLKRLSQEICLRLQTLTEEQIMILANGAEQEQQNMLWLAICKRYRYIYEFMLEVINEKCLGLDFQLASYDYDSFYNAKSDWHPELDQLSMSTKHKLKQVLFRILRELGLVSKSGVITQQIITPKVVFAIQNDDPCLFRLLPIVSSQMCELISKGCL